MTPKLPPALLPLLAACGAASSAFAQYLPTTSFLTTDTQPPREEKPANEPDIPIWVKELSNLPATEREEYLTSFAAAKQAYAVGRMAESESYLLTCQIINDTNPNVWSLRASIYIAQKNFDEALPLLEKVEKAMPGHQITQLNFSLYYLGKGLYEQCLKETDSLLERLDSQSTAQLCKSLIYRKVLCYLMLGQPQKAHELTDNLSPLEDSPLYYYSQAAYQIARKDRNAATRDMNAADTIFADESYLLSYKQSLSFSGLIERYMGTEEK